MTDFLSHIASRLLLEDKVVLPDFGRFILNPVSAKWDPTENKIYPPVTRIEFERLKENGDHSFLHYAAEKEQISVEEAISRWNEFSSTIKKELGEGKTIQVPDLGQLSNEPETGWVFTPLPSPVAESEPVPATLIKRISRIPVQTEENKQPAVDDTPIPGYSGEEKLAAPGHRWWLAGLLTAGVILLIILLFILLHYITSRNTPAHSLRDTTAVNAASAVPHNTPAPVVKQQSDTIETNTDSVHYSIIFATYHHIDLAEKQLKKLQDWGHHVVLIREDSNSRYLLAVPAYTLPADTALQLEKTRKNYGRQAYIAYPSGH